MRLIDADNISFYCNYEGDCTGDIDKCKKCENYICNFRDIQEQPTAYSVDKVVAELERFPLGNLGCQELNEIIEIVKQGDVYEAEQKLKEMEV